MGPSLGEKASVLKALLGKCIPASLGGRGENVGWLESAPPRERPDWEWKRGSHCPPGLGCLPPWGASLHSLVPAAPWRAPGGFYTFVQGVAELDSTLPGLSHAHLGIS